MCLNGFHPHIDPIGNGEQLLQNPIKILLGGGGVGGGDIDKYRPTRLHPLMLKFIFKC